MLELFLRKELLLVFMSSFSVFVVVLISCASCLKKKKDHYENAVVAPGPVEILSYGKGLGVDKSQAAEVPSNVSSNPISADNLSNNRQLPKPPSTTDEIDSFENLTNNNCCCQIKITDSQVKVPDVVNHSDGILNQSYASGAPNYLASEYPSTSEVAEVPAAYAISGRTPANPDFPYMTPPLARSSSNTPLYHPNFSGDSQDSKGYTSISVREPLEHIKACTVMPPASVQPSEDYYVAVSEDSDGVYAAIDSGVSAENSETYALIDCTGASGVDNCAVRCSHMVGGEGHLPGKRELNSPLPPAPSFNFHVYSTVNKESKPSTSQDLDSNKSIEDMYSKVNKHKAENFPQICDCVKPSEPPHSSEDNELPLVTHLASVVEKAACDRHISVMHEAHSEHIVPSGGTKPKTNVNFEVFSSDRRLSKSEINYSDFEIVRDIGRTHQGPSVCSSTIPVHAPISKSNKSEPNYETIKPKTISRHIHQVDSILTDPGYETVVSSVKYPPYAFVKDPESDGDSQYESVLKNGAEPSPGAVPQFSKADPVYASVKSSSHGVGKFSVPGTISIGATSNISLTGHYKDPNYECVVDPDEVSENDPNYEILNYLHNEKPSECENDHGYEQIKLDSQEDNEYYETLSEYQKSISQDYPLYEKLKYEDEAVAGSELIEPTMQPGAVPCYAQVKKPKKKDQATAGVKSAGSQSDIPRSQNSIDDIYTEETIML